MLANFKTTSDGPFGGFLRSKDKQNLCCETFLAFLVLRPFKKIDKLTCNLPTIATAGGQ